LHKGELLLARYSNNKGGTFLVGLGGAVLIDEDLITGLKREVFEESRIEIEPEKILFIEDLLTPKCRMLKIWFLCTVLDDRFAITPEAKSEGIIDISWYGKSQLSDEISYNAPA
jgi:ADP-ribose pyrophosphatase YjhB (NUDIX family)